MTSSRSSWSASASSHSSAARRSASTCRSSEPVAAAMPDGSAEGDSPSAAAMRAASDSTCVSAGFNRTQRDGPVAAISASAVVFP